MHRKRVNSSHFHHPRVFLRFFLIFGSQRRIENGENRSFPIGERCVSQRSCFPTLQDRGQPLSPNSASHVLLLPRLLLQANWCLQVKMLTARGRTDATHRTNAGNEVLGLSGVLHERPLQGHPSVLDRRLQSLHCVSQRQRAANVVASILHSLRRNAIQEVVDTVNVYCLAVVGDGRVAEA